MHHIPYGRKAGRQAGSHKRNKQKKGWLRRVRACFIKQTKKQALRSSISVASAL